MWTPRRLMLLSLGFVLFLSSYMAYARTFLGVIDGLPALPDSYRREQQGETKGFPGDLKKPPPLVERFVLAFGPGCEELKRSIRLELHARNTLLAAESMEIMEDRHNVLLTPISFALIGKDKG